MEKSITFKKYIYIYFGMVVSIALFSFFHVGVVIS